MSQRFKTKKKPREAQPKSAHRKFKRQQLQRGPASGAAPPTVHPGCRRFGGANVQRRDSAAALADAPQHVLRGRNDDAGCANRPQHRPQLPDPGVQGRRQPAGQPDEPAQHHAGPAEPAGVRVGRNSFLYKSRVPKQTQQFILVLVHSATNFTPSTKDSSLSCSFFNYLCKL